MPIYEYKGLDPAGGNRTGIIDADTPGMEGDRACRAIRGTRLSRDAKILAITAADAAGREDLLEAGADAVLSSPVSTEQLLAEVRRLLPGRVAGEVAVSQH